MAKPPMPDNITLNVVDYDANGVAVKDKYGVEKRRIVQSKARVKKTTELITNRNGDEVQAVLALSLPAETEVHTGDIVTWVDRFGVAITGPIETLSEVKNYSGTVVYYTKAYTGKKGS